MSERRNLDGMIFDAAHHASRAASYVDGALDYLGMYPFLAEDNPKLEQFLRERKALLESCSSTLYDYEVR